MQPEDRFPEYYHPSSQRVIFTATPAAKQHLFYLQETGYLKLLNSHPGTQRRNLNSFLLAFVAEGEGRLTCHGESYPLRAGQGFFLDCTRPHSYESSAHSPWALYWIHFNGPQARWLHSQFEAEKGTVFALPGLPRRIEQLEELMRFARERNNASEWKISACINTLLTELLTEAPAPQAEESNLADKIRLVHDHITKNFAQTITLDELSALSYVSKFHLARSFKEHYGLTLMEYQTHLRINQAKQLLRYSELSLEEIGERCGYKSQSYFSRVFRRTEGLSALEYRKSWKSR
ncbi:MAG: helix-turn-helix domain-containing protein [Oscillospiraceae bacterium]|nr:helix-turn-helix domain-containing protein [Oscillospiraceae bacterium]